MLALRQEFKNSFYKYVNGLKRKDELDFPGGTVVKNLPANTGDMGSIPGPGRSHMLWSN